MKDKIRQADEVARTEASGNERSWAAKPAVVEEEGLLPRVAGGFDWSRSGQSYLHFDREKDVPLSVVSNLGMESFAVVDAVAYGSKLLARKKFHSYNSRMKAKTEGGS